MQTITGLVGADMYGFGEITEGGHPLYTSE